MSRWDFRSADAAIIMLHASLAVPITRRYIGRVAGPMVQFLKRFKDKKIARHVSGVLVRVLKPAMKGNPDNLIAAMYGLMFLGDIAQLVYSGEAAEYLDLIDEISNGVESAAELQGIFSLVRVIPTIVDGSCLEDVNALDFRETASSNLLSFNEAYAAGGLGNIAKKIPVARFLKTIKRSREKVDLSPRVDNNREFSITVFLSKVGLMLESAAIFDSNGRLHDFVAGAMENILDENIMAGLMAVSHYESAGALKTVMRGDYPLRMTLAELLLAIATIEQSAADGELSKDNIRYEDIRLNYETDKNLLTLINTIRSKYGSVFIPVNFRNTGGNRATEYVRINKMNGEAFHLIRIAEALLEGKEVVGVEVSSKLFIKDISKLSGDIKKAGKIERRLDMVTVDGAVTQWWEFKSLGYNRQVANKSQQNRTIGGVNTFNLMNLEVVKTKKEREADNQVAGDDALLKSLTSKKGQAMSKEFFVDRVYAAQFSGLGAQPVTWIFHDFYKKDMPQLDKVGNGYRVSKKDFKQCGFVDKSSAGGACRSIYAAKDPMNDLRDKLVEGLRAKGTDDVKKRLWATIDNENVYLDWRQVDKHCKKFSLMRDKIVTSRDSRSWLLDSGRELIKECKP